MVLLGMDVRKSPAFQQAQPPSSLHASEAELLQGLTDARNAYESADPDRKREMKAHYLAALRQFSDFVFEMS